MADIFLVFVLASRVKVKGKKLWWICHVSKIFLLLCSCHCVWMWFWLNQSQFKIFRIFCTMRFVFCSFFFYIPGFPIQVQISVINKYSSVDQSLLKNYIIKLKWLFITMIQWWPSDLSKIEHFSHVLLSQKKLLHFILGINSNTTITNVYNDTVW